MRSFATARRYDTGCYWRGFALGKPVVVVQGNMADGRHAS